MLDQLSLTSAPDDRIERHSHIEETLTASNLFVEPAVSNHYYSTVTVQLDDTSSIVLYTMTIGVLRLNSALLIPYSILDGHRPFLPFSTETRFQRVRSKRAKRICRVTAIHSAPAFVQENDIILKVDSLRSAMLKDVLHR